MTDAVNVFSVTVACDNRSSSDFPASQSPKVAAQVISPKTWNCGFRIQDR